MEEDIILFPGMPARHFGAMYAKVWEQIRKDFTPYTEAGEAPDQLGADDLRRLIERLLNAVIKMDGNPMDAILYRIDLNERQMREMRSSGKTSESLHVLCEAILRREAQKVWIREQWRE